MLEDHIELPIGSEELEAVIKLEPFKRYKYFIKRVADSQYLFSVGNDNELELIQVEDRLVVSLWSHREYVNYCKEQSSLVSDSLMVKLSIYDFVEDYSDALKEENAILSIFPIDDYTGFTVTIGEFIRDMNKELAKYGGGFL